MMCGDRGPATAWELVGITQLLTSGPYAVVTDFPVGTQEGDLVVCLMSCLDESVPTTMVSEGNWTHWTPGTQDYLCTARYSAGLAAPRWQKGESTSLYLATLVFRAPGWSTVQLESNQSPASPVAITVQARHQLLLNLSVAPKTSSWVGHMPSLAAGSRLSRRTTPAMQVYSADIEDPGQYPGIYATSSSRTERNLILSAF